MKNKFELIVETAEQGHLSGYIQYGDDLLTSSADSLDELMANFREQFEGFYDLKVPVSKFDIKYNLQAFLDHHPIINASALADRLGWNKTLISQYKTGTKHPSLNQLNKIEKELREVSKELGSIHLI